MTRIDMTTREWHNLIKPVLTHVLADKDFPELDQVRIETSPRGICAIATDRYTLAAERHTTLQPIDDAPPISLRSGDLKATLKLFTYSKDDDPPLRVTIDRASVPIAIAGTPASVGCQAITLEDESGVRVVLRDATSAARSSLANWRKQIRDALRRPLAAELPAVSVHAGQLARWSAAVRPGERLAIYPGDSEKAPLLVLVEDHFAGLWVLQQYLDGPNVMLAESPWNYELHEIDDDE